MLRLVAFVGSGALREVGVRGQPWWRACVLGALVAVLALPAAAAAGPEPGAFGENDAGGFLNILPPGQGQTVNAIEAAQFLGAGQRHPHAQWCHDAVRHSAVGVVTQPPTHWTDRPTFQQAVEVQGPAP
jgi:hypothetical protein